MSTLFVTATPEVENLSTTKTKKSSENSSTKITKKDKGKHEEKKKKLENELKDLHSSGEERKEETAENKSVDAMEVEEN